MNRKVCEVYEELEPWMVGKKVEVGVYEKTEEGETGEYRKSVTGRLESYAKDPTNIVVNFRHVESSLIVYSESEVILVTVVVNKDKVPRTL
jgi:hypothetical protein